jgi:V/A-type H+-transporting ATPase subunit E
MTLEKLATDIQASADSEATELIKAAKKEAKAILSEAKARADSITNDASGKADKEADQIAREMVASARQANQKEILVARRIELDATLASARSMLGDASLAGRASLLKYLVKQAGDISQGKMVLRPTAIDRAALEDAAKGYSIGNEVEGLGGFVLEAEDGLLSFDLRFDTLLENAWIDQRAAVNQTLFG